MAPLSQTIILHREAPPKPALGAACNGCGVCCAADPCPVARVFLLQRAGSCRALLWQAASSSYACGMVSEPARHSRLVPTWLNARAGRFFASRIAAGLGCDSATEVEEA